MQLHFAPLQGYTTALYRRLHHITWGGIESYYTPFVRIEKGDFRRRDILDITPENNANTPVVAQMLPQDGKEMRQAAQLFSSLGYNRADINMGCPFPPVTLHGRGSGLLQHPHMVAEILEVIEEFPNIQFSIKMRLGWQETHEWEQLTEILNRAPLHHITLHPRTGKQQYKGAIHHDSFAHFCRTITHPIIYNGDITTPQELESITAQHPQLKGVMIGRGLLARPYLPLLIDKSKQSPHRETIITQTQQFHNTLYAHIEETSCGNTQLMQRATALWQYLLPHLPHRQRKAILKSTKPAQYTTAVQQLFDTWLNSNIEL